MSVAESGEFTGTQVQRIRLSGSIVKGVGMLEYFESYEAAQERRSFIVLEAPGAQLSLEPVTCLLDEDGEVLAELEQ